MGKYMIATIKSWNIENSFQLSEHYPEHDFEIISNRNELTVSAVSTIAPDYIFFPHWSWIIPKEIYNNFNCVVFHMTDLPFGRGGSPLQNLILRGIYNTKISAIRAGSGIDNGPIYFKEPIDISEGNADEIYRRISDKIFKDMIPKFFGEKIIPKEQVGQVVEFRRRTPEQSEIPEDLSPRQLYDFIRMLDGEGYPSAFKRYGTGRILYTKARLEDEVLVAQARFMEGK